MVLELSDQVAAVLTVNLAEWACSELVGPMA